MTQKIGPRELALRAMREADAARQPKPDKPTRKALAEKIAQVPARKPAKARKARRGSGKPKGSRPAQPPQSPGPAGADE